MKKLKSVVAILLAVILCFSAAPITAFANTPSATVLELGTATAVINTPGDRALFSFTPAETGKYALTSHAGEDTCAFLYDSNMEVMYEDDDSGDANNFYLSYILDADTTYYFAVKFYDNSINGSIPIELKKVKAIKSIAVDTLPNKTEYVENYVKEGMDIDGLEGLVLTLTWIDDTTDTWNYSINGSSDFEGVALGTNVITEDEQTRIVLNYDGAETSFPITTIPNPVESVEIIDNGFPNLIENTYGNWAFYHNEETNQDEEFFHYSYDDYYDTLSVKITYNDGTPDDLVSFEEWQHNGYQITKWDLQYSKPWSKGADDNTIFVDYLGAQATYDVSIIENPVQSIEIIDNGYPDLTEYSNGVWQEYWDNEADHNVEFYYYNYFEFLENLSVKINYSDGRDAETYPLENSENFEIAGQTFDASTKQYGEPWSKGSENNTITFEYAGKTATYNVNIVDSPVESIEIIENTDATIFENSDGWEDVAENGDPFFYYDCHSSYYFLDKFSIKINYNDGSEPNIKNLWQAINEGIDGTNVNKTENQHQSPWVVGGQNNTITFKYMGATTTYNVNIVANPVAGIEIIDNGYPGLIENVDGYWDIRWNDELGEEEPFFYYDFSSYDLEKISLKITYKDGREPVIHGVFAGPLDGQNITHSSDQYGSPWVKGGTNNTITFGYLGKEATYNVNIIENPVKEIEIVAEGNPTLIEYADGYYNENWDEETGSWVRYFHYELPSDFTSKLKVKITYTDYSHKFVPFEYALYGQEVDGRYMDVTLEQSIYNQWQAGGNSNAIRVEYLGSVTYYHVEIEESPVASIEIIDDNVTPLEEGSNGWFGYDWIGDDLKEYFCYTLDYSQFGIKINYKDTTKAPKIVTNITREMVDGYWINVDDNQSYDNQWVIGSQNNTITFSYMGATATYNMTIVANPVESIEITSPPTTQYIYGDISNGYLEEDGRYSLYLNDFTGLAFTVHFKDNTSKSYTYKDIIQKYGDFLVDGFTLNPEFTNDETTVGSNEVVITYRSKTAKYNINVTESPVADIEILNGPTKTEYTKVGFTPYYQGMKIKITYKEGGEKTIILGDDNIEHFEPDSTYNSTFFEVDGYYYQVYTYIDATDYENRITKTLVKGMGIVEVGEDLIKMGECFVSSFVVNSYNLNGKVNITVTYEDRTTETFDLTPIAYKDWDGAEDWYDRYFIAKTPHGTVCYNIYQDQSQDCYYFSAFQDGLTLPDPTYTPGDIDDSGEVTLDDVVVLAQLVAGWQGIDHNAAALDANGDGDVNIDDVVIVAQYVAGWSVQIS